MESTTLNLVFKHYCNCPIKTFRCTNRDFYVALGSSMGLALLVWVGGGLLKRVLYFFGNEPSLGRKSPILHLTSLKSRDNRRKLKMSLSCF